MMVAAVLGCSRPQQVIANCQRTLPRSQGFVVPSLFLEVADLIVETLGLRQIELPLFVEAPRGLKALQFRSGGPGLSSGLGPAKDRELLDRLVPNGLTAFQIGRFVAVCQPRQQAQVVVTQRVDVVFLVFGELILAK